MPDAVVLYTWLMMGHVNPMVELAKLFRRHGFAVTVVIFDQTRKTSALANNTVARLASTNPSITFHLLLPPDVSDRLEDVHGGCNNPFHAVDDSKPALRAYLMSFLPPPRAVIIDILCNTVVEVVRELHLLAFYSYSSSATDLASNMYLPVLEAAEKPSFKDMANELVVFPGVRSFRASDLQDHLLDRDHCLYKSFVQFFERAPLADAILLNSFRWLEPSAATALKEGLCLPGQLIPPVHFIGPLIAPPENTQTSRHVCLTWLDDQPSHSVVFLCFGSLGLLPAAQLPDIAAGLENSGQRFLWVLTSPVPIVADQSITLPDLDFDSLPSGFLDRTKDKGMVVKSWVPQAAILRHPAVGAFMTHCGWNSTLEAITGGVPMLCWPLYAEQRKNKVIIVEEMEIGVAMECADRVLVTAEEVAAKVRLVMEGDEGKEMRKRMETFKEMAAAAWAAGGESELEFSEFLKQI